MHNSIINAPQINYRIVIRFGRENISLKTLWSNNDNHNGDGYSYFLLLKGIILLLLIIIIILLCNVICIICYSMFVN